MGKSYNPFKMWGSCVGFGVGIISLALMYLPIHSPSLIQTMVVLVEWGNPFRWLPPVALLGLGGGEDVITLFSIATFATPIFLFLWGWGIHSLFRKFSSK